MLTLEKTNLNLGINSELLNDAILKMENSNKRIEEILANIDNTVKSLYNNDIWSGNTNEAYYERFEELKAIFPNINTSLTNLVKYLKVTNENYINAENSINNNIDTNNTNLNVN